MHDLGSSGNRYRSTRDPDALRQSAIVLGPLCSGKRSVAAYLGAGARRLLTLDECVEWVVSVSGKKKKLGGAGVENGCLVEELLRHLDTQEADGDAAIGKKSRLGQYNDFHLTEACRQNVTMVHICETAMLADNLLGFVPAGNGVQYAHVRQMPSYVPVEVIVVEKHQGQGFLCIYSQRQ